MPRLRRLWINQRLQLNKTQNGVGDYVGPVLLFNVG